VRGDLNEPEFVSRDVGGWRKTLRGSDGWTERMMKQNEEQDHVESDDDAA
jgi:hypothetical protein